MVISIPNKVTIEVGVFVGDDEIRRVYIRQPALTYRLLITFFTIISCRVYVELSARPRLRSRFSYILNEKTKRLLSSILEQLGKTVLKDAIGSRHPLADPSKTGVTGMAETGEVDFYHETEGVTTLYFSLSGFIKLHSSAPLLHFGSEEIETLPDGAVSDILLNQLQTYFRTELKDDILIPIFFALHEVYSEVFPPMETPRKGGRTFLDVSVSEGKFDVDETITVTDWESKGVARAYPTNLSLPNALQELQQRNEKECISILNLLFLLTPPLKTGVSFIDKERYELQRILAQIGLLLKNPYLRIFGRNVQVDVKVNVYKEM